MANRKRHAIMGAVAAGLMAVPFGALAAVPAHHSPIVHRTLVPRLATAEPARLALSAPPRLAIAPLPAPSVEHPRHKLFCVQYARALSGLKISGDAKYWWKRAKDLYARLSTPVEDAVMVFSGSKRLRRGHLAVVTAIVGPREIRVDQANWQNHGEIDHSTPILDVSRDNDWSRVRVWNMASGTFGTHVYAISGFITKAMTAAVN